MTFYYKGINVENSTRPFQLVVVYLLEHRKVWNLVHEPIVCLKIPLRASFSIYRATYFFHTTVIGQAH